MAELSSGLQEGIEEKRGIALSYRIPEGKTLEGVIAELSKQKVVYLDRVIYRETELTLSWRAWLTYTKALVSKTRRDLWEWIKSLVRR